MLRIVLCQDNSIETQNTHLTKELKRRLVKVGIFVYKSLELTGA